MKTIIQRVSHAEVIVKNRVLGSIQSGLVVFLGIGPNDTYHQVVSMVDKILRLRIFNDNKGKMNFNLIDINGSLLVVSQFTLYADCLKGNRPSFIKAADRVHAKKIYNEFVNYMHQHQINCKSGEFGAHMEVSLVNDGPVTLIVDTKE